MEVVGYCLIKKGATKGICKDPNKFNQHPVRVMEFCEDGAVLVVDSGATEMAVFEKEDVVSKFECCLVGDIVCPPNSDVVAQTLYMGKCINRKGGYNNTLKQMVIAASLHKGKFNDSFLWQLQ